MFDAIIPGDAGKKLLHVYQDNTILETVERDTQDETERQMKALTKIQDAANKAGAKFSVKLSSVANFANEYTLYWLETNQLMDAAWWQFVPGCGSTWNVVVGYTMTAIVNRQAIIAALKGIAAKVRKQD